MKPSVALCLNGFQCGSAFYPKEIAIADKDGNLGLVYYIKLNFNTWKSLSTEQRKVFRWQSSNCFNFTWSYPEGTVPLNEIKILLNHLDQLYNLYVENPLQQDFIFRNYGIRSAVIPTSITYVQTSLHCGLPQHKLGFICAYRRAVLNAVILNQWLQ